MKTKERAQKHVTKKGMNCTSHIADKMCYARSVGRIKNENK